MRIVVCDRCEKKLVKEKCHHISLEVVVGSVFSREVNLGNNPIDLCEQCHKDVTVFVNNTPNYKSALPAEPTHGQKVLHSNIQYYKNHRKDIIKQLEACEYTCEGGNLACNTAFIAMKEIFNED